MRVHGQSTWRSISTAVLLGSGLFCLTGCATPGTAISLPRRPTGYPPAAASSQVEPPETVAARYSPQDEILDESTGEVSAISGENVATPAEAPLGELELLVSREESSERIELAARQIDLPAPLPPHSPDASRSHGSNAPLPQPALPQADGYPIDLATAFHLAGANNLQIALAAEQVRAAVAQVDQAELLWVPSLDVGIGYNRHDGQIQDTQGQVIDVRRQSAFVGGGPRIGDAPLNGLAGGPPRLFLGLNPAEAYFAPLAARQGARAEDAGRAVAFNDTLLDVGLAYYDLLRAQMRTAIAQESVANVQNLVELTENFVEAGTGLQADFSRARAQLAEARVELLEAQKQLRVSSAELARLLRLDPAVILFPADPLPLPVTLVPAELPLPELIRPGTGGSAGASAGAGAGRRSTGPSTAGALAALGAEPLSGHKRGWVRRRSE